MEENMKKNIYLFNWVTLLYSRNEHNIVRQLYVNKIKKIFHHWIVYEPLRDG